MKVSLINPDYMLYGDPPIGLAYLAAYLKKTCSFANVEILDQITRNKILKRIKKEKPEIIGITSVTLNYFYVKNLAIEIKKVSPKSILIIGGVHITTSPSSFQDSPFDIAVIGEGEITMAKLLDELNKSKKVNIKSLSQISGLLLRKNDDIINTGRGELVKNLDDIPIPNRYLLNMKYYLLPRFSSEDDLEPVGSILTSRGCPYSCKFCSSSVFWGQKVRFFSAKRVVEEIEILHKKYKYNHIYIYDDLFSINKKRLKDIVEGLKQKKLIGKIKFSVYGRSNCLDEEVAVLLKQMNVKDIIFGFETGSEKLLNYLKGNNVTIKNAINAIKISNKYNLNPGGFFMIGSPTETVEDMKKTYNFIKDYCRESFIIYQTIAFPGTNFWDYAIKEKIYDPLIYEKKQKKFTGIDKNIILSKKISGEELDFWFKKIRNLTIYKKKSLYQRISKIRMKHLRRILSKEFILKANNLKKEFIKRT